jgi:hypothetical protein
MNKHETIGRLALLLGAAAHLPEGCKVLGYHVTPRYHEGPPSIFVEGLDDLPDGLQLPVVNLGNGWLEHAVETRGVKVFCYVPMQEKVE